jgi:hypothetical protein
VLPTIAAAQHQSVALTEAYLARALERQPIGVDPAGLIGASVRNGTDPATVYTRPFIVLWAALKDGKPWAEAFRMGQDRAVSAAATDVQLSQRATFDAVQRVDSRIVGYVRVPDATACGFCERVAGAFVKSGAAMPLHPNCGCTLDPVERDMRITPLPEGVAVHDHGELGPVLTAPGQHFTTEHAALAA